MSVVHLYRAVSLHELIDIGNHHGFRLIVNSLQGKWFAENAVDAAKWGHCFFQQSGDPFHIIQVSVPQAVADQMFRLPNLDQIGPARYAERSRDCDRSSVMGPILAHVRLHWLTAAEGGRRQPFAGTLYAATARFPEDDDLFSIFIRFPQAEPNPPEGQLGMLFPDRLPLIQARLKPGCRLEITEGPKTVAHCQVVALEKEILEPVLEDRRG